MEGRGEVCLAEEAERLRRSGLGIDEVARRMGVDAAWVETVVVEPEGDEEPTPPGGTRGPTGRPRAGSKPGPT